MKNKSTATTLSDARVEENQATLNATPDSQGARQGARAFNVLLTCAGQRVELLRSFREAMKTLGLEGQISVAEYAPLSAAGAEADHYFQMPAANSDAYLPGILDVVQAQKISLVVPLTDLDIYTFACNQEKFAELGALAAVGTPESIGICRDKLRFAEYLVEQGIPAISTQRFEEFQAAPYFPCFAKPISGSSSVGASPIDSLVQLTLHAEKYGTDLILQPFVPGQEYTIDIYKSRSGEVKVAVPRQRLRVRCGEVEQAITSDDPALLAAAKKLALTLDGLWGVFCAQCRRTPEGEILFYEVNPRFGGGVPLSIQAGANLPLYLIQDVLGLDVSTDGTFTPGLLMMRYPAASYSQVADAADLPGFTTPIQR